MKRYAPSRRTRRPAPWRRPPRRLRLPAATLLLLGLAAGRADAVEDLYTARSQAVGEAFRADAAGAIGPLLNPSGMALTKAYTIEAIYGFDVRTLGNNVHLSIADSTTSRVAAGIYYNFIYASPRFGTRATATVPAIVDAGANHTGSETGLALALALGDWFHFGVTLKYLHFSTTASNPYYDSVKNPTVPQTLVFDTTTQAATASGFTMDAGITIKLGDRFNLAAVGYNLVPLRSFDAPIALGLGIAIKPAASVAIPFDCVINFDKYQKIVDPVTGNAQNTTTVRLGGGIEWLAGGKVPLRLGAVWDNGAPATYLTAGLGYVSTSFGIDLTARQQLTGGNDTRLLLGLRVFIGANAAAAPPSPL